MNTIYFPLGHFKIKAVDELLIWIKYLSYILSLRTHKPNPGSLITKYIVDHVNETPCEEVSCMQAVFPKADESRMHVVLWT